MPKVVSIKLDGDLEERFNRVKGSTGLTKDREVIRHLISDRFFLLTEGRPA